MSEHCNCAQLPPGSALSGHQCSGQCLQHGCQLVQSTCAVCAGLLPLNGCNPLSDDAAACVQTTCGSWPAGPACWRSSLWPLALRSLVHGTSPSSARCSPKFCKLCSCLLYVAVCVQRLCLGQLWCAVCLGCLAGIHATCALQTAIAKRKRDRPPAEARREAGRLAVLHESVLNLLAWVNLAAVLGVPCWLVRSTRAEPLPGFVVMILDVTLFLKLWSWWHCNQWLR